MSNLPSNKPVLLAVPFEEKDTVKALGARWDADGRTWYVPAGHDPEPFRQWWALPPLTIIPGEDRTFGGSALFVDLIPSSCWFTNIRSAVSPADWLRLRTLVRERAGHRCEICGDDQTQLHAHERWQYHTATSTQSLRRLICLCAPCHEATHFGLAQLNHRGNEAAAHIARINGWSLADVFMHVEAAFEVWRQRCCIDWHLDLSILDGIATIVRPAPRKTRRSTANDNLNNA